MYRDGIELRYNINNLYFTAYVNFTTGKKGGGFNPYTANVENMASS
jgi:hypothetical protein